MAQNKKGRTTLSCGITVEKKNKLTIHLSYQIFIFLIEYIYITNPKGPIIETVLSEKAGHLAIVWNLENDASKQGTWVSLELKPRNVDRKKDTLR